MRKKFYNRYAAVFLAVFLFLQSFLLFPLSLYVRAAEKEPEENGTTMELHARSAVLMDADSGRVLYGKNEDEAMPMASTTKIMTCILALENGNPEDTVTASSLAASQPKVHLGMREGQQFQLRDLLYSLMLESHNDSAAAVAEHIGGSIEGFALLMNQKARDIGCFDTFFITPNGLDAEGKDGQGNTKTHSTTARDLARIMAYCIGESEKKEEFLAITGTQNYSFTDTQGTHSYACVNHNAFLTMMDGALSGKTGFTGKAGYCYVGALKRDERTFVVALLACGWPNHKGYKWKDTAKLMEYGLDNYEYRNIYEPVNPGRLPVEDGIAQNKKPYGSAFMPLKAEEGSDAQLRVLLRHTEKTQVKLYLPEKLTAPVTKGEPVGSIRYYLNGELIKEYAVVAADSMNRLDLPWIIGYVWRLYSL